MKKLLLLLVLMVVSSAKAETFIEIPSAWILENYDSNGVIFSQTPASCANGRFILPSTSSIADRNRLFAMVMSAKMTNTKIAIAYSISGNSCIVTKFSNDELK